MTWRWLICFSLGWAPAWGTELTGSVVLRDSRETAVRKGGDFSGVVVSLAPMGGAAAMPAPKNARMDQRDKRFLPHVLAIPVGATVDFPNNDPIFHNAFSSYSGQIFDVGLYPPGKSRAVKFSRPGVVRVFCNIHPSMSAVIVVLNTQYFAVTDRSGRFTIKAPPGDYELRVFHERATEPTLRSLTRVVHLNGEAADLGRMELSEAGFLPSDHKNKYGLPYPAEPADGSVYTGVKK